MLGTREEGGAQPEVGGLGNERVEMNAYQDLSIPEKPSET